MKTFKFLTLFASFALTISTTTLGAAKRTGEDIDPRSTKKARVEEEKNNQIDEGYAEHVAQANKLVWEEQQLLDLLMSLGGEEKSHAGPLGTAL